MKTAISRIIFCTAMLSLLAPMQLHAQGTDKERQDVVDKINQLRATKNLPALSRWNADECADKEADAERAGGRPHALVACTERKRQNSGWTTRGMPGFISQNLQQMWDEGPGGYHYDAMVGNYTEVAVGISKDPNSGLVYVVQDFK